MRKMTQQDFSNLTDEEIMSMETPPEFVGGGDDPDIHDLSEDQNEQVEAKSQEEESEQENEQDSEEEPEQESDKDSETEDETQDQEDEQPGDGDEDQDEKEEERNPLNDPDDYQWEEETPKKTTKKPKDKAAEEEDPKDPADAALDEGDEKKTKETQAPKDDKDSNKEEQSGIDYKSAYEKVFAPFKANGREVKVNSPDEVIQLMQMGANYAKKMEGLKPHLKMVKMLENQGLLDEAKLTYLIDLSKGDKEAVQKLVKDSGVDPMDIDTEKETGYKPGNYQVSDAEMAFTSTLEDVSSNPDGKEIIRHINKTWDTQSKNALWDQPELLRVLTKQKSDGLFDQISDEVERRRLLGQIQDVPFLEAYYAVGQEMDKNGQLTSANHAGGAAETSKEDPPAETQLESRQQNQSPKKPLETRKAVKRKAEDQDRVKAASPMRTKPKTAKSDFNPLALSDEEFEKHAELGAKF